MKKIAIIVVIEPISYSLDRSVAWTLTSVLKAKQQIALTDSSSANVGSLIGIAPILQPMRINVSGQSAFLLAMRADLEVTEEFDDAYGTSYSIGTADHGEIGLLSSCTVLNGYADPYLLVSSELSKFADFDTVELGKYVNFLTSTLWKKEPINWTTHRLHLASNGQFMTSHEMASADLVTGMPVFAGSPLKLVPGPKSVPVGFQQWSGAGTITAAGIAGASGSSCTSHSVTTSGGSGDGGYGGDGGTGDGGDGFG